MKVLIAYYTLTGNTQQVAEGLADLLEEWHEVVTVRIEASRRFSYYHALLALVGGTVPIRPLGVDADTFDAIILGSPVWAGSPVPAINTFIDDLEARATVCPFVTCRANSPSAMAKMRSRLRKHGLTAGCDASFTFSPNGSLDNEHLKVFVDAVTGGQR